MVVSVLEILIWEIKPPQQLPAKAVQYPDIRIRSVTTLYNSILIVVYLYAVHVQA